MNHLLVYEHSSGHDLPYPNASIIKSGSGLIYPTSSTHIKVAMVHEEDAALLML